LEDIDQLDGLQSASDSNEGEMELKHAASPVEGKEELYETTWRKEKWSDQDSLEFVEYESETEVT
jgi:hypothetical protein